MRLLLIEDDAHIARELTLRWQAQGRAVRSAATLQSADAALAHDPADLVVLDLGLPDGDGRAWLRAFRAHDRSTPVLILTARDQVADRVHGLRDGADDYLVKPFAVDELDARVEALARRIEAARGDTAHFGDLTWMAREGRAYCAGAPLELSPREFEVLGLLIQRAPRLVSKRVLLDALAARNLEVHDNAVELYVSRLRRKLAASTTAIRTSRGFGYQLTLERRSEA